MSFFFFKITNNGFIFILFFLGLCRFLSFFMTGSSSIFLKHRAVLRNFPGKCVCEQTNLFCKVRLAYGPVALRVIWNNDYIVIEWSRETKQQRRMLMSFFSSFNNTAHGARPYSGADHSTQHTQSSVNIAFFVLFVFLLHFFTKEKDRSLLHYF